MKFLTIKDYSSELEAFNDCLKELTILHNNFKANVNFKMKDRKHAFFLLIGASISSAHIALDLYSRNLIVGVYQLARYILEVHSLIEYFIILDSDSNNDLDNWFNGKFIDTRYKKQTAKKIESKIEKKSIIPFKTLPKDELIKREKIIQENFNILSLYSHPTVYSTKFLKKCNFSQLILLPIIDNSVDVQRLFFAPEDSITGLMFSEFRVLFNEFKE
jgi:hypothetical protein